LLRRQALYPA